MSDYRRGFESLRREIHEPSLPIEGDWPPWLEGTLIRNGPAQFEVEDESYNHWFDGHAMLHAFRMRESRVEYRNRFVESKSRTQALNEGRIARSEFATDPCSALFGRAMSLFNPTPPDNPSINVARLDDQYAALGGTPMPVMFDPETLASVGGLEYDDDLTVDTSTPHPHVEPQTGRTLFHTISFGLSCKYVVCSLEEGRRTREVVASLDVAQPSYMHSFGMTDAYVILSEWPLVVDPTDLFLRGKPFIENFNWQPHRGTRFRVLRKSDGAEVATCTADAAFGFHHVNAFERDDAVVCDIVTYPDASIIDDLYLDRLRSDAPTPATGQLWRYHLPLGEGTVSSTPLSDECLELPRIHDAGVTAQPYTYVYGVGTRIEGNFTDQLVKIDVITGEATPWYEEGTYPGEPVFVPAPAGSAEDEGVVLSVVLDPQTEQSVLIVLDAASFRERARVFVPHPIPFGFHGQFFQ